MKTQILSFLALFLCFSLSAQENNVKAIPVALEEAPAVADNGMRWNSTTHDFGTIELGVPQTAEFVITNSGDEPLIITGVKSTCGCTAANHADGPILPGESSTVTATYNAKRPGPFRKAIKVSTNRSETPIPLTVMGTVSE